MSRITKTIAEQVAKKLTQKKSNELADLETQLKTFATKLKIESLPPVVEKTFRQHEGYFNRSSSEYFTGPGLSRNLSLNLSESLPRNGNWVQVKEQDAEIIIDLQDKISDLESHINKVRKDVEVALMALRTYSNIEKEFPEAFPHLPERTSMALAVNIGDVRKMIA